jgi:DNA-binding NarL/FixJ family response regulator
MILLVVGAMGVCDPEPQSWIASLSSLYANTPLVLVSDREDATEVVAALEAGARGFIPTSIAPQVAIHACAFIISGGSYFPPAALTQAARVNQIAPGASKQLTVVATASVQRTGLTARQQEVLELLRQGESNKLIGRQLKLRESTVKVHVRQIMRKLGASNRTQAALTAAHLSVVATDREASTETEASEPEDNGDATKCPPLPAARSAPEPKAAAPALTSRLVPR